MKHFVMVALFSLGALSGCRIRSLDPPPTATIQVLVLPPTWTPGPMTTSQPMQTPFPTATVRRTTTPIRKLTPSRTPTRPAVQPAPTQPKLAPSPIVTTVVLPTMAPPPTAPPPGTLFDGNYAGQLPGNGAVQLTINNGGTIASRGYFSYTCDWFDNSRNSWSFASSAAITNGRFQFTDLPDRFHVPQVSMTCASISAVQVKCDINDLNASRYCHTVSGFANLR